jgi:hypothetical protein
VANVLDISDFRTERLIFECKYPAAYRFWDTAGTIASELMEHWPGLQPINVMPGNIGFQMPKKFVFSVEVGRSSITFFLPDATTAVAEESDLFFRTITKHIQISLIERLGLRFQCFKELSDRRSSACLLLSTGLLKLPEERVFGAEGDPVAAEVLVTFEGKGLGGTFKLASQSRQLNVELPPEFPAPENMKFKMDGLLLDVDLFTTTPFSISMVGVKEWIEQALHVFKRDVSKFLR